MFSGIGQQFGLLLKAQCDIGRGGAFRSHLRLQFEELRQHVRRNAPALLREAGEEKRILDLDTLGNPLVQEHPARFAFHLLQHGNLAVIARNVERHVTDSRAQQAGLVQTPRAKFAVRAVNPTAFCAVLLRFDITHIGLVLQNIQTGRDALRRRTLQGEGKSLIVESRPISQHELRHAPEPAPVFAQTVKSLVIVDSENLSNRIIEILQNLLSCLAHFVLNLRFKFRLQPVETRLYFLFRAALLVEFQNLPFQPDTALQTPQDLVRRAKNAVE